MEVRVIRTSLPPGRGVISTPKENQTPLTAVWLCVHAPVFRTTPTTPALGLGVRSGGEGGLGVVFLGYGASFVIRPHAILVAFCRHSGDRPSTVQKREIGTLRSRMNEIGLEPAHTVAELASARQHQGKLAGNHGARGGG